jgi:hypothetical protein
VIAIDPGASGGIASVEGHLTVAIKMPDTDREIVDLFEPVVPKVTRTAYLEDLVKFTGRNMPSSSMATYAGNWGFIRGVLTAFGYRIVVVHPKTWQKALGLGSAKDCASKTVWKNKLKNRAEQLFPDIKVTLATADALLILEAARRGLIG